MATRYSGNLTITCLYQDRGDYKCTVSPKGRRGKTVYVRPPAMGFGRGVAYDSPEAYDQTARAAISFAGMEGVDVDGSDGDGTGFIVHRRPHPTGGGGARARTGFIAQGWIEAAANFEAGWKEAEAMNKSRTLDRVAEKAAKMGSNTSHARGMMAYVYARQGYVKSAAREAKDCGVKKATIDRLLREAR